MGNTIKHLLDATEHRVNTPADNPLAYARASYDWYRILVGTSLEDLKEACRVANDGDCLVIRNHLALALRQVQGEDPDTLKQSLESWKQEVERLEGRSPSSLRDLAENLAREVKGKGHGVAKAYKEWLEAAASISDEELGGLSQDLGKTNPEAAWYPLEARNLRTRGDLQKWIALWEIRAQGPSVKAPKGWIPLPTKNGYWWLRRPGEEDEVVKVVFNDDPLWFTAHRAGSYSLCEADLREKGVLWQLVTKEV